MSSAGLARHRAKSMPISEAFKPIKAMAVDLFPHTPHCELVMLLERQVVVEFRLKSILFARLSNSIVQQNFGCVRSCDECQLVLIYVDLVLFKLCLSTIFDIQLPYNLLPAVCIMKLDYCIETYLGLLQFADILFLIIMIPDGENTLHTL